MTTIFADAHAGVMVCDSKCSSDEQWYPITKVHRINGELIGIAGDVKEGRAWLAWYAKGSKGARPKGENFAALVLRKDGKCYEVSWNGLDMEIERGYHGIGTGGGYAIAAFMAMHDNGMQPDARLCVEIACRIDSNSGGEVHVHKLKP